jgi:glycosyltransferase involved in cell wall biosynthesis
MERTSLVCADALTAVSQAQCDYFKEHYSADCEYIPTAAEMKPFAPASLITQLGLRPQEYVLYAARLVPEKGLHYLIRAFRRVPTSQTLVIAGEAPATGGYEQEIRKLAGDDPRIRFVGRVEGRLLQELFSNTTLFVQPSELEGLSIGLIEAMSYGAACLASDIPENQEVVADAGILFRSKDVNDLEQQLRWSLASPAVLRDRAAVGKARALNLFSWDRVVDQLESLYDRTLERVASNRGEAVLRHPAVNPNVLPE